MTCILIFVIVILILALNNSWVSHMNLKKEFKEYRINMEARLENHLRRKLTKSERH